MILNGIWLITFVFIGFLRFYINFEVIRTYVNWLRRGQKKGDRNTQKIYRKYKKLEKDRPWIIPSVGKAVRWGKQT